MCRPAGADVLPRSRVAPGRAPAAPDQGEPVPQPTSNPADASVERKTRWLFLMRHAEQNQGRLTEAGRKGIGEVAARFVEWLEPATDRPDSIAVLSADTPESKATARELRRQIAQAAAKRTLRARRAMDRLNWTNDEQRFREVITKCTNDANDRSARDALLKQLNGASSPVLLVANDPLVSLLVTELRSARLFSVPTAVTKSELVCLRSRDRGKGWRLEWSLAPFESENEAALLEKIKSKMSIATALGGLIVALLTGLVKDGIPATANAWRWAACLCLLVAGVLYFATLFLYDTLQMPARFWAPTAARPSWPWLPSRPPTPAGRVIYAAMVHVWKWVFLPATVLLGMATVFLVVSAATPPLPDREALPPGDLLALIVGALAIALGWVFVARPRLGTSD